MYNNKLSTRVENSKINQKKIPANRDLLVWFLFGFG